MENHQIILQDEHQKRHKIIRVHDVSFNSQTLMNTYQWLWIYAESYEFFPFELWECLDRAQIDDIIQDHQQTYRVTQIFLIRKPKFS
ncbi:hypothetical protein [Acinetobacter ihumii]|uniref:hypothetical protein n=1 Tax=Acinetobacter ihumii TaxID=2483802 RepID=UPI0010305079|nr:hypothetical protein [Acinetobacter ihumii]